MTSTEEKSEDKKEIEDEEREKMLNEENARDSAPPAVPGSGEGEGDQQQNQQPATPASAPAPATGGDAAEEAPAPRQGEVEKMKKALEESEKDAGKAKKIPIGGIRIPGFLRSRSREKNNKDGDSEQEEENKDLLADSAPAADRPEKDSLADGRTPPAKRLPALRLIPNPFKRSKDAAAAEQADGGGDPAPAPAPAKSKRAALLEAIQLPLVNILPRRSRASKDPEVGQAGLASMETLDDRSAAGTAEDGMESVKLDVEDKAEAEKAQEAAAAAGKSDWRQRLPAVLRSRLIIGLAALLCLALLAAVIAVAAAGPQTAPSSAPLVSGPFVKAVTSCGFAEGVREGGGYAFRGLPFALPPVGPRRWQPPQPINSLSKCWEGTLVAHNATPACWQRRADGSSDGDEDCLTLEVYTPRVGYHSPLPVVVLIDADSLVGGSPGALRPSARLAAERDVVFVRPNFRLGPLGLLAHQALTVTTYPHTSGNYALHDILEALRWVQLNIQHFAGSGEEVTVLGHRAGATLVTALASSRESRGLFKRVWLTSGSAIFPGHPLSESASANARYVKGLPTCAAEQADEALAACLRRMDAAALQAALPPDWLPRPAQLPQHDERPPHQWLVLDGRVLQSHPFEVFDNRSLPYTVVIGTTQHAEATAELRQRYAEWEAMGAEEKVRQHVEGSALNSSLAQEALRLYGTSWPGFASLVSDIRTVCPLLVMSRRLHHMAPFFYVVTQTRGPQPAVADAATDVDALMGRYHAGTNAERRFVKAMQAFFYRFVKTGELRREDAGDSLLLIGEENNPSLKYPNCDLWIKQDVVPRYARAD